MAFYNPIAATSYRKTQIGQPAENTRFANSKMYFDRYWSDENFTAVEKLAEVAEAHGLSLLQLAMKWCAAQERVTSIITGVSACRSLSRT